MEPSNILSREEMEAFVAELNQVLAVGVEPLLNFSEEDITCLVIIKARGHAECYEVNRVSGSWIRVYTQP